MKKYYKFLNHIISFDLPGEVPAFNLKQLIPSIKTTIPQKEDIFISFISSEESNILFSLDSLTIKDLWNDTWIIDIPHLVYSYLKYVFFHKEIYFVHSCLIDSNLLIGHSGTGKTTLCVEAIKKNLPISSLDRTCVKFKNNQLIYLAGTDILSVRSTQTQPALILYSENQDRKLYQYDIENTLISKISIFQISEKIMEKEIEGLSRVHQLFPFFIDTIKTDCFIQNGRLLFSPIYCEDYKKILFNHLINLNIETVFVRLIGISCGNE